MNHEIPWTFKKWIVCFKDVDLPIGDLAEDISGDPDFPDEDYFGEILEHISNKCNGDPHIIETFVLAWGYYLASKDPSHPTLTSL
ncbi:MAG: YozE family protein [Acetatifactor sp.]